MYDPDFRGYPDSRDHARHRTRRIVTFLMFAPFLLAFFLTVFGFAVKALWNWLMPLLFGLSTITFWQAWGLLLLSWILLGGFRGVGGYARSGYGRRDRGRGDRWERWRRWREMTPEQRAALREQLDRCWEQAAGGSSTPGAAAPEG
jgi:hypothetical protein